MILRRVFFGFFCFFVKNGLERDRDYFEFGKLASTSRIDTSSSYIAQMETFTIKYQDFFCDIRQDLTVTIANSGVEGKVPVYTEKMQYVFQMLLRIVL